MQRLGAQKDQLCAGSDSQLGERHSYQPAFGSKRAYRTCHRGGVAQGVTFHSVRYEKGVRTGSQASPQPISDAEKRQ